jgi:hypothetical protein
LRFLIRPEGCKHLLAVELETGRQGKELDHVLRCTQAQVARSKRTVADGYAKATQELNLEQWCTYMVTHHLNALDVGAADSARPQRA